MLRIDLKSLLNGQARKAAHTTRYSSCSVIRQETVAEHTFHSILISYVIASHLSRDGVHVDFGSLLTNTLCHDLEESKTGDILRNVKHSSPEMLSLINDIGSRAMRMIDTSLDMQGEMVSSWIRAKDSTAEGQILRVADLLSVVSYLVEDYKMGNRTMEDVHQEVTTAFNDAYSKVQIPQLQDLLYNAAIYFTGEVDYPIKPVDPKNTPPSLADALRERITPEERAKYNR